MEKVIGKVLFFNDGFAIENKELKRMKTPEGKFFISCTLGVYDPDQDKPITPLVLADAMSSIGWVSYDRLATILGEEKVKEIISKVEKQIGDEGMTAGMDLIKNDEC